MASSEIAKQFISLVEASKLTGLSPAHLRRFAGEGRFWAVKMGRDWVTTKEAIRTYIATNPKPGRKSKKNS